MRASAGRSLAHGLVGILVMCMGCETGGTTGQLGLVTSRSVDSALLLKTHPVYRTIGPTFGSFCTEGSEPSDNFAKVAEQAMNPMGADALIDVMTLTHRGSYFPEISPAIIAFLTQKPPSLPAVLYVSQCTAVSGTAIKFIEPPNCAPCVVERKAPRPYLQSEEAVLVASLQPTLQWEPFSGEGEDIRYELTVWRWKAGLAGVHELSIVYERQGLSEPSYRIEAPLEPETHYFWAVRAHSKLAGEPQVTLWSYDIGVPAPDGPMRYYHFWTPTMLSIPQ